MLKLKITVLNSYKINDIVKIFLRINLFINKRIKAYIYPTNKLTMKFTNYCLRKKKKETPKDKRSDLRSSVELPWKIRGIIIAGLNIVKHDTKLKTGRFANLGSIIASLIDVYLWKNMTQMFNIFLSFCIYFWTATSAIC